MKKFIIGLFIASVLFFIGYLTGFHPVAFYVLCLFTAGIAVSNFPLQQSADIEFLTKELELKSKMLESEKAICHTAKIIGEHYAKRFSDLQRENTLLKSLYQTEGFNPEHLKALKESYLQEVKA